jgi:DNA helicase-2/ATP-dependent DNA helicase PcrA
MEVEQSETGDKVSLMTLHGAKGLEFDTVFLPGWEEGLFPSQRSMDENGLAGLEEERRLAYVGITRAKKRAHIFHAANRRVHGLWQSAIPSRFVSELPGSAVEFRERSQFASGFAGQGMSENRWSNQSFSSGYDSPGWRRAQASAQPGGVRPRPPMIEGHAELVATNDPGAAAFATGVRVYHPKFGYGRVTASEGNKLTVRFEAAGEKKVLAAFLQKA